MRHGRTVSTSDAMVSLGILHPRVPGGKFLETPWLSASLPPITHPPRFQQSKVCSRSVARASNFGRRTILQWSKRVLTFLAAWICFAVAFTTFVPAQTANRKSDWSDDDHHGDKEKDKDKDKDRHENGCKDRDRDDAMGDSRRNRGEDERRHREDDDDDDDCGCLHATAKALS